MREVKTLKQIIGEAVGEASMCWSERPTGVFDSERASRIVDKVWNAITSEAQATEPETETETVN